jgi:hypothetical protein
MARVDSRSCTNSGSVGTSNDSRSALPAQSRNGFDSAFSLAAAALAASSVCASRTARISASPSSRAALRPSQSSAGDSDESYR